MPSAPPQLVARLIGDADVHEATDLVGRMKRHHRLVEDKSGAPGYLQLANTWLIVVSAAASTPDEADGDAGVP